MSTPDNPATAAVTTVEVTGPNPYTVTIGHDLAGVITAGGTISALDNL